MNDRCAAARISFFCELNDESQRRDRDKRKRPSKEKKTAASKSHVDTPLRRREPSGTRCSPTRSRRLCKESCFFNRRSAANANRNEAAAGVEHVCFLFPGLVLGRLRVKGF